jgi:lipopolysaccharide/colanic/teichoic acid biosynthesis glycosyltransferase
MTDMIRRLDSIFAERSSHGWPRMPGNARDFAKRTLDVVLAGFAMVVLAIPWLIVCALIRLDSPGPALFRQVRIGKDGQPFTLFKFRTMAEGNDDSVHEEYVSRMIREGDESLRNSDGALKLEGDARITRMGRVLRKTSLDEVPQLLNVIHGEMSLVGPRPPLAYEVELYEPRHRKRLDAVPGITGLWQVSGRNMTTFEEMVDLDVAYIENRTFWLDLKILAKTVPEILHGKGA